MRISFERGAPSTAAQLVGGGLGVTAHIYSLQWWIGWALFACGFVVFVQGIRWDQRPWWRSLPKLRNPFRRRGVLYVGRVVVGDSELDEKHFLDMSVIIFNATNLAFQNTLVEGYVELGFCPVRGGSTMSGGQFQGPLVYYESNKPHKPFEEFTIGTRLFLRPEQVEQYREHEADGDVAQLSFSNLTISVETKDGKRMRVPMWDGVSVRHGAVFGRIHSLVAHATARVSASMG